MDKKRKALLILIVGLLVAVLTASFCLVYARVNDKKNGYYISTVDELLRFRDEVNGGNDFRGVTVYQAENLDLSVVGNWVPIGISGSGNYFYGEYNALGHQILNMRSVLCEESSDNALFGQLGGTVSNLALVDFYVNGGCLGGIASSSADDKAVIYNCTVSGTFEGTRGGAIADNFVGGKVFNCWADCSYVGKDDPVPLVSYDAIDIYTSYSTGLICDVSTFTGRLYKNEKVNASYYNTKEFAEKLNENQFLIILNCVTTYEKLTSWKYSRDGVSYYKQNPGIVMLTLSGTGKKEDPYLISSYRDLAVFACGVNENRSFSGYYLRQTCDFDLTPIDVWRPIGIYNSNRYFNGFYDGGGHTISNMKCEDELYVSRNNGYFGMLGGTVVNLGIESAEIYGECVGGIASHAVTVNAKIINCYSRANLYGLARSGGIADNFIGYIENCVYFGSDESVPLVAYRATHLFANYSNTFVFDEEVFSGRDRDNYTYGTDKEISVETVKDLLNARLQKSAERVNQNAENLFRWRIDGETVCFEEGSVSYDSTPSSTLSRLIQVGGIALVFAEAGVLYYALIYHKNKKKK